MVYVSFILVTAMMLNVKKEHSSREKSKGTIDIMGRYHDVSQQQSDLSRCFFEILSHYYYLDLLFPHTTVTTGECLRLSKTGSNMFAKLP